MPRYWVQDFDTHDEQKSKPGKPVYDLGMASRLKARHWSTTGSLAGVILAEVQTNVRLSVCSLPRVAVPISFRLFSRLAVGSPASIWASFVFDYVVRQKVAGATLKYFIVKQFPTLPPDIYGSPAVAQPSSPVLTG